MSKVCVVVASPATVRAFLLNHLAALGHRYDVTLAANLAATNDLRGLPTTVQAVSLPIERRIAPLADVRALASLCRLFRAERFQLVHSITPKAGLLAMVAARLVGVPVRLHTFTGQVWVTRRGALRILLKAADWLTARLATNVLTDSLSQRAFLIEQGIVAPHKCAVLGRGSLGGVDAQRFRPDPSARARLRQHLGCPEALVILYLGRLNRDKGLLDLARAFSSIGRQRRDAHLLLVGPDEEGLLAQLVAAASPCGDRLRWVDATDRPQDYFALADVACLPSYREGFPTTIIEAAAVGLPTVGSRIYGITDAIVEGVTGLLFPPGNVRTLTERLMVLLEDDALRKRLGDSARQRATQHFSADSITEEWLAYYARVVADHDG